MERKALRFLGHDKQREWCECTVCLEPSQSGVLRLSVTFAGGRVLSHRAARAKARAYWESFFGDDRAELARAAREWGKRTPRSAADYVLRVDGPFHGLDVHSYDDEHVLVCEWAGQAWDEAKRFFDIGQYRNYHLNDLHAGCEHQDAQGVKSLDVVCSECGHRYGSQWLTRELPQHVIDWARSFGEEVSP